MIVRIRAACQKEQLAQAQVEVVKLHVLEMTVMMRRTMIAQELICVVETKLNQKALNYFNFLIVIL